MESLSTKADYVEISKDFSAIEDKLNKFIRDQDRHIEEMKHIMTRLEVKIEAYGEKLVSLNKEIKMLQRKK